MLNPLRALAADESGERERLAVRAALQRSGRHGLVEDRLVGLAQVRVEVGEVSQPRGVQSPRALELVVAVEAVRAARQEVHLGLGGRHGRVRVAQRAEDARLLGERDHVRLAGLDPGAVGPGRRRGGLATGRPGEAPQRVGRARTGEDAQVEPAGVDLDAPARLRAGGSGLSRRCRRARRSRGSRAATGSGSRSRRGCRPLPSPGSPRPASVWSASRNGPSAV